MMCDKEMPDTQRESEKPAAPAPKPENAPPPPTAGRVCLFDGASPL